MKILLNIVRIRRQLVGHTCRMLSEQTWLSIGEHRTTRAAGLAKDGMYTQHIAVNSVSPAI